MRSRGGSCRGLAHRDGRASLKARAGIATGSVVVGDMAGEVASERRSVTGATPNLAARLEALALPGEVVIGKARRRLLGGAVDLAEGGRHPWKGFAEPVAIWRVTRWKGSARRTAGPHCRLDGWAHHSISKTLEPAFTLEGARASALRDPPRRRRQSGFFFRKPSLSRRRKGRNRGSCAPQSASPVFEPVSPGAQRPAMCLRALTAGSPTSRTPPV